MKYLSRRPQISMQSHAEIVPRLKELVGKLSGEELRLFNKELTYGHVINGLILLLLDNPEAEQLCLVREAIARMEDWMLERDPRSNGLKSRGLPLTQMPALESKDKGRSGKR